MMCINSANLPSESDQLNNAFLRITQTIGSNKGDLASKLSYLSKALTETLQVSQVSIWQAESDLADLRCLCLYNSKKQSHIKTNELVLRAQDYPRFFNELDATHIIDASDAVNDPRTSELGQDYLRPFKVQSVLGAALRQLGKTFGVVSFESLGVTRCWNEEEQHFAVLSAQLVAQLIIMDRLRQGEIRHKVLYEDSSAAIFISNEEKIIDCNPAAVEFLCGHSKDDIVGKSPLMLSPEFQPDGTKTTDYLMSVIKNIYDTGEAQQIVVQQLKLDGSLFWSEATISMVPWDDQFYLITRCKDVSAEVEARLQAERAQRELEHKKLHDELTGLPNRNHLYLHIAELIENIGQVQQGNRFTLIVFDLNRFKEINDTLGHDIGDQLLVKISERLNKQLASLGCKPFRLGGDEFAVVFSESSEFGQAGQFVNIINQAIKTPLVVGDVSWETTASMGFASYPEHGKTGGELLKCADVAMYAAKSSGQMIAVYDSSADKHSKRRLSMMTELGKAIKDNQLQLYYQPRINIRDGELTGCEALIRWQHPKLGFIPPTEFIPLAEVSNLIHSLSHWVADTAMAQARRWQEKGLFIPIAINISARNLTDQQLSTTFENLLNKHELSADAIEIEITESALMNHPMRAIENLQKLSKMQIRLAMDDFGTGYSSLSYLKKLPINVLKIDRSFVSDLISDNNDRVIVESTVDLAHNFSLQVVAEGVEDAETLARLAAMGCDQAQGYHLAKPLPIEEFELWIESYFKHGYASGSGGAAK